MSSERPIEVSQFFPMLSVASLEASLRFYRGLLGGEKVYQFPEEGTPAFVLLRFGASQVGLGEMGNEPPLHGQALRPAQGHRVEFCLYVRDVDAAIQRLMAEDVTVLLAPVDMPWGERVAYVADPDGNLLMLTQANGA